MNGLFLPLMDDSTKDSVLLAQELNVPLYTDDRLLRAISRRERGMSSFSSLILFVVAEGRRLLSMSERYVLQRKLIDMNYRFISMNAHFLFSQLKEAYFDIEKIKPVISVLTQKDTNIQSLALVLSDLLILTMTDKTIPNPTRRILFVEIIKSLPPEHNLNDLEEGVFLNLQKRTNPIKHPELKALVQALFALARQKEDDGATDV